MEDDSSNDVIEMEPTIATIGENESERPLLQFFERLVINNTFKNTVLTNVQIEEILTKEFHFNLLALHELEVFIYISILKRFLKDWPMWDEFDRTVKELTTKSQEKALKTVLETQYESLKSFLKEKLDMTNPLAAEWGLKARDVLASKMKEATNTSSMETVALEVQATREQLNKLIYRYPHPKYNDTIFNAESAAPSHIRLNTLSLEAILNWWSIRIQINLQWVPQMCCMFLKRETTHKTDFCLVNHKLKRTSDPVMTLNENIQVKESKKFKSIAIKQVMGCLDLLSLEHGAAVEDSKTIIEIIRKDLECLPYCLVPADYRRYLNKYPYVRYLYSDVKCPNKSDTAKYDIQLREIISPMHQFSIGRVEGKLDDVLPAQWLKVDCVSCSVIFTGENLVTNLMQHFNEYHQVEPDWQCTNCKNTFTMAYLAENWWRHSCESGSN